MTVKKKSNRYILYSAVATIQFILLIVWTLTQKGVLTKTRYYGDYIYYNYKSCSTGNKYILSLLYAFDYILLLSSILNAYRGRNSMKKIF